ncbi:MAG: hypothetical protein KDK36_08055 [Leptospiraceae bacterium]|nr:hypothetical protein [Leptospiraceae bacterium]
MSNFKKIALIFIIIISYNCKKKDKEIPLLKDYDTKQLIGTWDIIPSKGERIVFEPGNKVRIIDENGDPATVYVKSDKNGIRFLKAKNDITPIGYFLFTEKKKDLWSGIWKKEVVRMEKEITRKKSILE